MTNPVMTCPTCGPQEFRPGFIDDVAVDRGAVRWVAGPMQVSPLGRSASLRREQRPVLAYACGKCGRLELYVGSAPDRPA